MLSKRDLQDGREWRGAQTCTGGWVQEGVSGAGGGGFNFTAQLLMLPKYCTFSVCFLMGGKSKYQIT